MPKYRVDDGTQLFYRFHETEEAANLVFLNGMTQSTNHWKSHVRALSEQFSILTYDARGQGQSDIGEIESIEQHAGDLKALLEELGIETTHLAGFSHGGRVALQFAHDYGESVDKLLLCGISKKDSVRAQTIVRSWKEILDRADLTALAWASLPTILGTKFLENNEEILEGIIKATVDRNSEEGIRQLVTGVLNYPEISTIADDIDIADFLALVGDEDPLCEWRDVKGLADQLDGKAKLISDVGHTVPIEAPDEFRDHLTTFLES